MIYINEPAPNYMQLVGEKDITITFDTNMPEVYLDDVSCYGLSDKELKQTKKKPFITTCDINVLIDFEGDHYFFTIPKGYRWNGANVPAFAWAIIGQRTDPRFKLASCLHDYMCEHHEVVKHNRYVSTLVFVTCCEYFGAFPNWKLWSMKHSVDNYQKVFGKWKRK